jgi:hypothetical protein
MNADQGDERRSEGTAEKLRASDDEVIHKELTGEIIAAFYHVYNTLGTVFWNESIVMRWHPPSLSVPPMKHSS